VVWAFSPGGFTVGASHPSAGRVRWRGKKNLKAKRGGE